MLGEGAVVGEADGAVAAAAAAAAVAAARLASVGPAEEMEEEKGRGEAAARAAREARPVGGEARSERTAAGGAVRDLDPIPTGLVGDEGTVATVGTATQEAVRAAAMVAVGVAGAEAGEAVAVQEEGRVEGRRPRAVWIGWRRGSVPWRLLWRW